MINPLSTYSRYHRSASAVMPKEKEMQTKLYRDEEFNYYTLIAPVI
ncbi:MAG: hypothetical protein ACLUUE_06955 [Romboutsia timonensis]